jgi:hypothetical protein
LISSGVVVAKAREELGALEALGFLPDDYSGPCGVFEGERIIAVVSQERIAVRIAGYAISPGGGYTGVSIRTCNQPVTHATFEDWIASPETKQQ